MSEEKTEKKEFSLVEVPTDYGIAIQTPEGEQISANQLLVRMANDLKELRKNVG